MEKWFYLYRAGRHHYVYQKPNIIYPQQSLRKSSFQDIGRLGDNFDCANTLQLQLHDLISWLSGRNETSDRWYNIACEPRDLLHIGFQNKSTTMEYPVQDSGWKIAEVWLTVSV